MELYFQPVWPWWLILLIFVGLVGFSIRTYEMNTPQRRWLLGLRLLAILLAIIPLLRPRLVWKQKLQQSSVLMVLVDKSRSMNLKDMWDNKSRWEALQQVLETAQGDLKDLEAKVDVHFFSFARQLASQFDAKTEPEGDQTALGDALKQAVEEMLVQSGNKRLAGIVVLSDGVNTQGVPPISVARELSAQKIPVYTFCFGATTSGQTFRDVAARRLLTSPVVFAKNRMSVRGEFQFTGLGDRQVPVRLLVNGVPKEQGLIQVPRDGGNAMVELSAIPEEAGEIKVSLVADTQDGELLTANNTISTFVTVLPGGISVLHVEGKYRAWEPKFIRWALDQSPDIELYQTFLLERRTGFDNKIPEELLRPGQLDVLILGDVAAKQFAPGDLDKLARLVENGTGLLMIGGYESFGPGGWGDSPLAKFLPVMMRPTDGQIERPLQMMPTAAGLRHYLLRLGDSDESTRQLWAQLKPLDGGSLWSGKKLNARLLASALDGTELLVELELGGTRALAFASDTTWRWRRNEESRRLHARFWRQMILWLCHREEEAGKQVRLKLARRRLSIGQKLPVEVEVVAGNDVALENITLDGVIELPDGRTAPLPLLARDGTYDGSFYDTLVAGDYTVRVQARLGTEIIGTAKGQFLVYDEQAELLQLAADLQTLQILASETAGESHPPEEFPQFIRSLKERDLNQEVTQPITQSLWDRWEFLLLFILVVSAEWFLRKRAGLA